MRMILPLALGAVFTLTAAHGQGISGTLMCSGDDPDWSLDVNSDAAQFDFQRQSDLDIALVTTPMDADWPRAITLIGRGDSAILMVEPARCDTGDLSARILTQRGETPILLVGCCQSSN